MGIGNIFDIGASGILAQRLAIEVTGENIANINTDGYSRQQVVMANAPVTTSNGFALGTGVEIEEVRRYYDAMLQQQIMNGNSTYQQNLARETALEQIQPSFNELNADGLGTALEDFFGAWSDLSTNAGGAAERQSLLSRSQILVDTFHNINSSLTTVSQSADNRLIGITSEMTDNARNLALVNSQIVATRAVDGNANELLDQRDLLIRELSEKAQISVSIATDGSATVTLHGGETLVSGTGYATIYTSLSGTNRIMITDPGNPPSAPDPASDTDITLTVGGSGNNFGEIGGTLQVRDSIVPEYLARLDEMASKLIAAVNAQHAAGFGLDGTTGNSFFSGTSSATIQVESSLTAAKIAAALPTATDPVPTSAGNNVNAVKIAEIQKSTLAFSTGNATFAGYFSALVGKVGTDTQGAQNVAAQGEAFLRQLNNLRESNSGVSLDEELTNLAKYQQAFQGAARVVNAATEMLDTLIEMVR